MAKYFVVDVIRKYQDTIQHDAVTRYRVERGSLLLQHVGGINHLLPTGGLG